MKYLYVLLQRSAILADLNADALSRNSLSHMGDRIHEKVGQVQRHSRIIGVS